MEMEVEQLVRVYCPQARWILTLAALLNAGDPTRERAFDAVLEGHIATEVPLSEARRRRV